MAAEYLTATPKLEELVRRMRKSDPSHTGPWHFQFVLRAEVYDRLATRAEIVALRVLDRRS